MTSRHGALLIAVVAALGTAAAAEAQDWQVLAQSRQARSEDDLRVSVRFASGAVDIRPGAPGLLYRAHMRYDGDHFDPSIRYREGSRRLSVHLSVDDHDADIDVDEDSPQRLELALAPSVPLNLSLDLGATANDIELGGLALKRAELRTGASQTTIRFSTPTTIECERFEVTAGAAELVVDALGNAGCERMEVRGGVGDLTINLRGDRFTSDSRLEVSVGLGQVTLEIPRSLGVRVQLDRLIAGFDRTGFERHGGDFVSENYDRAARRLDIEINAVFGDVDVIWLDDLR